MSTTEVVERQVTEAAGGFAVFNRTGSAPEVWLYGVVGDSQEGVTAAQFRKELDGLGSPKELTVRINSVGGSVGDGLGIYNCLKRHPAKVIIEVDGIALSAASLIAMAGDEVRMAENALMMIHNAWDVIAGDAAEMRKKADQLDIWNGTVIAAYTERTKIPREKIAAMMSAETWMEPAEAKRLGFADVISAPQKVAAKFDPARFRNVPAAALRRAGIERPDRQRAAIETEKMRQSLESLDRRRAS